ncbi:MAG: MarR family winged helix-turn-helix transcriptional regulator [Gordonia sp. (in: high G+C Gram-positive bacteria)]
MSSVEREYVELADLIVRIARELDPREYSGRGVEPLCGTDATVLRWIHRNPGTTPSDTAEATRLRRPNLSAALRSLEDKGLVERRSDPADARCVRLRITPRAQSIIALLHSNWSARIAGALGARDGDVGDAVRVLERLVSGLAGDGSMAKPPTITAV